MLGMVLAAGCADTNKMNFQFYGAHSLTWEKGYMSILYPLIQYMFMEQLYTVSSIRGAQICCHRRGAWGPGRPPGVADDCADP